MDCPDSCTLEVTVEGQNIVSIEGTQDHPTTKGFICSKIREFGKRVDHESRLLTPMRRVGAKGAGEFVPISWGQAISTITDRFRSIRDEFGAEAILPYHYGGSNGVLGDGFIDSLYFSRLGASRLARTLCATPTGEVATGMYGKMAGVAFNDYPRAKCIVIWGANPKASNIHLLPFLQEAKKNGAFIAVVDPKLNFSPKEIDLHLPVVPGGDLPLALAMIRIWKEAGQIDFDFLGQHADGYETLLAAADAWPVERAAEAAGIEPQVIRTLADVYAEATPAVIRCGWGLERNRNGGQAVAAIMAIPALMGKFGVAGGGYTMSNSGATTFDLKSLLGDVPWDTRIINMSQLGTVLTGPMEPPIKGMFVYNCNPAVTVPDQNLVLEGLSREDLFTVVFDQVMTDSALYADIILPAVTFLEQWEIKKSYGAYIIGGVQPVIEPRGEARPNEIVFGALGQAMGFEDEAFRWDSKTAMKKVAGALRQHNKTPDLEMLEEGKAVLYDFPDETPVQFGTVFPNTADRKAHLTPPALGSAPYQYDPIPGRGLPLSLISPASGRMITSSMGEFSFKELTVMLSVREAETRDIRSGQTVRVYNGLGEVICKADVSDKIRDGVVSMAKGAWFRHAENGKTSTALCPSNVNIVGGGACFNDARVEVERHQ